jgi:autotransporter translocation and assembly factor TamB
LAANIDASWSSYDPESLHVASELHGTQLQYAGRKLPDLDATLAMKDGIGRLNIRHPVIQADISGRLHADSVNARYVLSISDLRPVAGLADVEQLSGRFRAKGQVNGTFVNPELTAAVSGASIKYSGWPIDTLVAQLRYRDSVLRVIDLSARGELDSIDAGMLPVDSVPVGGRLRYSLTGSGTVDSMNAVFTADVRQPHYGEYSLDSGSVAATLNGTTVHVDFLNAWHNNLYAVIQGRFDTRRLKGEINGRLTDLAAGDTLTVDSATDSLNAVKGKGPAGNFHAAFDLSDSTDMQAEINGSEIDLAILSQLVSDSLRAGGTVSLNGRFDGTPARPNASLKATATAVQYDRYVIDSVAVSADLSPGELKLSRFTAYVLADTLSVAGSVPLKTGKTGSLEIDRARPLNGTIRARQVDLTALQKILPDSVAVSGRLDVNLDVGGTADLPSVSGNVTLADGEFNPGPERPPLEKININADLLDSTIIIKSASAEMKSRPLSLTGKLTVSHRKKVIASLDLEMPESASVRIDGWASTDSIDANVNIDRIRLSLLASYVPNVHDLRGLLVCNLTMTGNLGLPAVHGQLRADSIGFALQMYPVTVSGGAARISFTRERIRIDTLNAGLNGGSVSIDGWVEHSGEQIDDVQLTLNARNIDYHQPGFVNLKLDSAALAYDHQEDFFLFQGDVYLGDSKFTRNLRVPEILPWARSVERIETTYPSPLDKTRLDIRMRQNGELWIDDNIAKLRLNAAIGMRGSPARPTFSGRVGVDEGYLLYLDRQFEVTEGTVYFADPRRFNPDITLRAEAHVTTYEGLQSTTYDIKFSAAGPLDQLETKLTSEPPLDKPDIVSVLTIGATRGQLLGEHGAGGQGTGSVLLERAGAISTREISGYVSRELGGALGLDELSVQGNLFSSTSEPTRITAAKQVTTRAKLSYSTAVGHANDQRVRLDYKLTPRFMLEGMTDQSGKALISLKYSLKFK